MIRKIDKLLNNKQITKTIAKEIAETFVNKANKENIDYSFDIAKGTGKIKTKQPNTSFYFDTTEKTSLHELKKALFDKDLKDIQPDSDEEKELIGKTREFLKNVAEEINCNYNTELKNTIRRVILPGSGEENIPLNEINIISIDIADFSSIPEPSKYMLKIGKISNLVITTDKITTYVHNKQEETGKSVEAIFAEEKGTNPLFKDISSLERGRKYLYDINITFFVDYSLSSLPPEVT